MVLSWELLLISLRSMLFLFFLGSSCLLLLLLLLRLRLWLRCLYLRCWFLGFRRCIIIDRIRLSVWLILFVLFSDFKWCPNVVALASLLLKDRGLRYLSWLCFRQIYLRLLRGIGLGFFLWFSLWRMLLLLLIWLIWLTLRRINLLLLRCFFAFFALVIQLISVCLLPTFIFTFFRRSPSWHHWFDKFVNLDISRFLSLILLFFLVWTRYWLLDLGYFSCPQNLQWFYCRIFIVFTSQLVATPVLPESESLGLFLLCLLNS